MNDQFTISLSDIINSIIALAAIMTLFSQIIQSRRNSDFSFQPKFTFKKFCNHDEHKWTPMLCDGSSKNSTNKCNKDHWFNIHNDSTGVAFKVEIFMVHEKEVRTFKHKEIETKRGVKLNALIKDSSVQYKLSQGIIPVQFYNQKENDSFYVIVSYETISRFNRFIQVIQLGYVPIKQEASIKDWKDSIEFNGTSVEYFEKISWFSKLFESKQRIYSKALKSAKECQNDVD